MDYSNNQVVVIGVIISNIVALIMLYLSWKKMGIARLLFFLLFTWAGITNITTALKNPDVYLEYADFALIDLYKNFIQGFFSKHIMTFVIIIAVCQLLVAISMLLKGRIFKLGCIGGMIFLLSILPLGFGSGSPSPLIWAIGLFILFREAENQFLWQYLHKKRIMV